MNPWTIFGITLLLVIVSAFCSGLNVSLMALDIDDLERKAKLGNKLAQRVLPLRKQTHLFLSSILLVNVAAVSATSLVLDSAFHGLIAGIATTLLMVIFGEVFPQAFFLKNALKISAILVPFLWVVVVLSYPIAKPLQLLLDKLFRHEGKPLQTRHELGLMITEHIGAKESDLDEDEIEIVRGALQLSEKRVRDIMTPIEKVYWLPIKAVIDSDRIDEIKEGGYSRIPVFNDDQTICYGILLTKQLVDIDFDNEPPRVSDLRLHSIKTIGSMTALDTMFREFVDAHRHFMMVEREDAFVGIITIEDLIEEIIGHEIEDETDTDSEPEPRDFE